MCTCSVLACPSPVPVATQHALCLHAHHLNFNNTHKTYAPSNFSNRRGALLLESVNGMRSVHCLVSAIPERPLSEVPLQKNCRPSHRSTEHLSPPDVSHHNIVHSYLLECCSNESPPLIPWRAEEVWPSSSPRSNTNFPTDGWYK